MIVSSPHRHRALFLRRALTRQRTVGAVAPTSTALARRMARLLPRGPGVRVVELGAGTGAISSAIGDRLGPDAVHLALERDRALVARLAEAAPAATVVCGDAARLGEHLARRGIDGVDAVLSSLPWSNFAADTQERILDQVAAALGPAGSFATIAYRPTRLNPASRRFHRLLEARFAQVVVSATTWANLPPARLVVAHGPRRPLGAGAGRG